MSWRGNGGRSGSGLTRTVTEVETMEAAQLTAASFNDVFIIDADPLPPIEPPSAVVVLPVTPTAGDKVSLKRCDSTQATVYPGAGGAFEGGLVPSLNMSNASGGDCYVLEAQNEQVTVEVAANVPAIGNGGHGRGLVMAATDRLHYEGAALADTGRLNLEIRFIPDRSSADMLPDFPYLFDAGSTEYVQAWMNDDGTIEIAMTGGPPSAVTANSIEWDLGDTVTIRIGIGGSADTIVEYSTDSDEPPIDLNGGSIGILPDVTAGMSNEAWFFGPSSLDPWRLTGWIPYVVAYDVDWLGSVLSAEFQSMPLSTATNGAANTATLADDYFMTVTRAAAVIQTVPVQWRVISTFTFGSGGGGGSSTSAAWLVGTYNGSPELGFDELYADLPFNAGPANTDFMQWPGDGTFNVLREGGVWMRLNLTGWVTSTDVEGVYITIALTDSLDNVLESATTRCPELSKQYPMLLTSRLVNLPQGSGYKIRGNASVLVNADLELWLELTSLAPYTIPE